MTFHRGEWVVYQRDSMPRTGRVTSDENGCGIIVEDQDDATSLIVARADVTYEPEDIRIKRETLGYYAQDLL